MSLLNAVRVVLGAVVLLQPRRAAAWWGADPKSGAIVWAARVLGGRHLAQAVVVTVYPTRGARALSSTVDLLHGASMLVLAAVSSRLRRPAATSAGVAFVCAAGTLHHSTDAASQAACSQNRDLPVHGHPHLRAQPIELEASADEMVRTSPPSDGPPALQAAAPSQSSSGEETALRPASRALTPAQIQDKKRIAKRRAGWLTRRSQRLEDATVSQPMPLWSPAASGLLLLLGVWLLVGQWILAYPFTIRGQNTALRDTGFAVVLSLAALRLLVARRSRWATGIALLCGVLLICAGLWATHGAARAQVNELVCGALVVVCALATLDHRETARSNAATSPDRSFPPRRGSHRRTAHEPHLSER